MKNCTAHIHTDTNNNFLQAIGKHIHLLEPENLEVKRFRRVLKERVINETASIQKIYDEEIVKGHFSPEILASIPMVYNIQPGLNQARRQLTPTLPDSNSFDIPDGYQTTASGLPCVFGILPDRKKNTYQQSFQELKTVAASMGRIWKSEQIMMDFESGLIPAISAKFPESAHKGCHFHFVQSLYRRIQTLGLATAYSQDEGIRSCCRKLMALPFLPVHEAEN
ncbi:unnamed protein product [Didymodactylos carnosus]|uniref:MULE transposase domain-containing protein n=1 Tax=Didymodactylos carnosus TaxID=1234261 RepID=A0A815CAC1_9BILA|nr:unnamed protein product [Didymodactylos carnosus]CAF1323039.1 unnamed protein product [Didymodactylos carnosus]CAF4074957.1 unnamed protein product [Didymodactylos carnosus]CAF4133536.1 unnamed protein product [Didymodactylos carnosus]